MIKQIRYFILALTATGAITFSATAQVKMGDNPAVLDTTAVLELSSTSKGFLPPRLLQSQMAAILNPATGLMAYCLNCTPAGLRVYNGTAWATLGTAPVRQAAFAAASLSCADTLKGIYELGIATLSATNVKQISILVDTPGAYTLRTDTVNGVSFRALGSIGTASLAAINLVASGTPLATGVFTYTVSAPGQSSCTFSVPYRPAAAFACDSAATVNTFTPAGFLLNGTSYSGAYTLPYTAGNGSSYATTILTQNGLTLTRTTGTYASNGGNVVYTLSGTYTGNKITEAFPIAEGCTIYVGDAVVSTLAGSGIAGFADGTGTTAQFSESTTGLAADTAGNVYVADWDNNRIRKVTATGVVSTFAGSSTGGSTNGTGTGARFNAPSGIAVDASGTIYVADRNNQRIRKITPAGVVSTLAGSGVDGFADGAGTAAQFNFPVGVAVDASGNVYVADQYNYRIRKITPAGVVSTLAGSGTPGFANGTGPAAQFSDPASVAVDTSGNVYVADPSNNRIRKITPAGVVTTFAGSGNNGFADGTGTAAEFSYPNSVAVDASGRVYVADNNRVRIITTAGAVSTFAGSGEYGHVDGNGAVAQFNNAGGIAVDPSSGKVYVIDRNETRIRKIAP